MSDVLTAIDDALETGAADRSDPALHELQELALLLQADSPEPAPPYQEWLDRQVDAGFPKRRRSGSPGWLRVVRPVAAVGALLLPVALVALLAGGPRLGSSSDGGSAADGGGGAVAVPGAGSGGGRAELAPEVDTGSGGRALARALPVPPRRGGFVPGQSERRIERSIGLELEMPVEEMAAVAERVTAVTNRHGGFVLSSSVATGEDGSGGDFELRIPATRLRVALRDLSALADVRSQSQTGRDVTRRVVTARDRLEAARSERRGLLSRLEAAATDEEAESLRRRLDLVAAEINGLRGQLRGLRLRTNYAVVTVSLLEQEGDGDSGAAGGSFDDALGDAGDLLVTVAGVIVRVLAAALPLALVALLGWLAAAALRRRRRESALA